MTPGDYYIARKFQNYYWYNYEGGNYAHLVGAIIDSVVYGSVSGILNENAEIPSDYKLFQNYPNPFNPLTKIRFSLPNPSSGEGPGVRLVVYNVLGKEVATLVNETLAPGNYEVEWNASNHPSGIYFYRLTAGDYTEAKKMILTK